MQMWLPLPQEILLEEMPLVHVQEELPLPPRPEREKSVTPSPPPPAVPAEITVDEEDISPEDLEPPRLVESVTPGRESPYRYVHGAPLHNVVEEEEEE